MSSNSHLKIGIKLGVGSLSPILKLASSVKTALTSTDVLSFGKFAKTYIHQKLLTFCHIIAIRNLLIYVIRSFIEKNANYTLLNYNQSTEDLSIG